MVTDRLGHGHGHVFRPPYVLRLFICNGLGFADHMNCKRDPSFLTSVTVRPTFPR